MSARRQLSHSNSRHGALVSLSLSPLDDRVNDCGGDGQGDSEDKHPDKKENVSCDMSFEAEAQNVPFVRLLLLHYVLTWPTDTFFNLHSSKGGPIWYQRPKKKDLIIGRYLTGSGPDLAAGSKERNKTRPKNVGTAFAQIFGSGDTMQHKTCCCLFSQVVTYFFENLDKNILTFDLQQIHLLFGQIHCVIWKIHNAVQNMLLPDLSSCHILFVSTNTFWNFNLTTNTFAIWKIHFVIWKIHNAAQNMLFPDLSSCHSLCCSVITHFSDELLAPEFTAQISSLIIVARQSSKWGFTWRKYTKFTAQQKTQTN